MPIFRERKYEYDFKLSVSHGAASIPELPVAPRAVDMPIAAGVDVSNGGQQAASVNPFGYNENDGNMYISLKYSSGQSMGGKGVGSDAAGSAGVSDAGAGNAGAGGDDFVVNSADSSDAVGVGRQTLVNGGAGYVILDAGHGGVDPGSIENGAVEKDIGLEVTLLAAKLLDEAGIEYILTRNDDSYVSIEQRIELANIAEAAFYVSVHCDWFKDKSINGTSTLHNDGDAASKELAGLLQSYLTVDLGTADRDIHPHKDIVLLRDIKIPAVIVELAFISNEHDLALLRTDEFKEQAARNLADGIFAATEYAIIKSALLGQ